MASFCTKCGSSLLEGSEFCTACGRPATPTDTPPAVSIQPEAIQPQTGSAPYPMVEWQYKVVALQRDFKVINKAFRARPNNEDILADYLESVIAKNTSQGWEFYRIDTINMVEAPGCLGSLFGIKETTTTYNLVTFRKSSGV